MPVKREICTTGAQTEKTNDRRKPIFVYMGDPDINEYSPARQRSGSELAYGNRAVGRKRHGVRCNAHHAHRNLKDHAMTQTTTSGTQPATLNERELFNAFLKVTIERNISIGGERVSEPSYTPLELLLEAGSYGELDDVTMMLLDYISDAEDPEETIQALHDDLAIYVDNLATVLSGFKAFKSIHSVEDDLGDEPEDQHSEAYKEWSDAWDELQRNPRFLVPTALEEAV